MARRSPSATAGVGEIRDRCDRSRRCETPDNPDVVYATLTETEPGDVEYLLATTGSGFGVMAVSHDSDRCVVI